MMATWLYDPTTDRWARVVWRCGVWVAQCSGRNVVKADELDAIAAAERMAAERRKERIA